MSNVEQLYSAGEKLKDEGDFEAAVEKFEQALEQDETYALAHFALAVVYGKLGRHDEAVRHGQRACQLEPDDAFSYTAMSVTYQRAFAGTQNPRFIQLAEEAMAKAHALESGR